MSVKWWPSPQVTIAVLSGVSVSLLAILFDVLGRHEILGEASIALSLLGTPGMLVAIVLVGGIRGSAGAGGEYYQLYAVAFPVNALAYSLFVFGVVRILRRIKRSDRTRL